MEMDARDDLAERVVVVPGTHDGFVAVDRIRLQIEGVRVARGEFDAAKDVQDEKDAIKALREEADAAAPTTIGDLIKAQMDRR